MKDHLDATIPSFLDEDAPDYCVPDYSQPIKSPPKSTIVTRNFVNQKISRYLGKESAIAKVLGSHSESILDAFKAIQSLQSFTDQMNAKNTERNERIEQLEATNANLTARLKRLEGFFTTESKEEE